MTAANEEMRLELVDDQREGPQELGEGHRRLGNHPELDLPADVEGGHDQDAGMIWIR